jgi:amphi-Trp domain-containing protein
MAQKEKLFKSKEHKSREEVSRFLKELADKISSGSVSMIQGEQEVTFQIPDEIKLDVEAEQKDKGRKGIRQELEIELQWYEGAKTGSLELK